jgi:hypothetical protein
MIDQSNQQWGIRISPHSQTKVRLWTTAP